MPKKTPQVKTISIDSIHKIWKLRKVELMKDPNGTLRTVAIDNYDLWDLTKKDTLSYSIKDSIGVIHSIGYKMINNALVLQFPDKKNNVAVQFKIAELTADKLKVILHVTYTMKEAIKDEDIIALIFEEQKQK